MSQSFCVFAPSLLHWPDRKLSNIVHIPSSFRAIPKSSLWTLIVLRARDPRRQRSVAFRARKENFTRMYLTTSSYRSPRFVAIFSARDLWKMVHSWLITPDVVNTNGVNEPCSTSMTRRLYCLFLSISCFRRIALTVVLCWLLLSGLVIRTSKKAFCPFRQKPRARMSRRALSSRFADFGYPCFIVGEICFLI